jgi:hypothetical protein
VRTLVLFWRIDPEQALPSGVEQCSILGEKSTELEGNFGLVRTLYDHRTACEAFK